MVGEIKMDRKLINKTIKEILDISLKEMKEQDNIIVLSKLKDTLNDFFNICKVPHGIKGKVNRRSGY